MHSILFRHASLTLFLAFAVFIVGSVAIENIGLNNWIFGHFRGLPHADKLGHFFLMGGLNFLAILALAPRYSSPPVLSTFRISGGVIVLFVLEESSQGFIGSRTFSAFDLLADFTGVIFFGFLAGGILLHHQELRKR